MDYSRYRALRVSSDGRVVTVTINRPEARNAMNEELHEELGTIFTDLDLDDGCDVAILTGAGSFFSAGGDMSWIRDQWRNPALTRSTNRTNRRIQHSLLELEKPIIAKVRGAAVGLGCSLALYCDLVYASTEAVFSDPHVAAGLVAADGGAALWPQLVGYARARRYLLTGDPIRGTEAETIGLITEAVPDEQLDEVVDSMARRLASGARYAVRYTKAAINAALKATADVVIDRASAFETMTQFTEDNRIAVEAFLAKEKPTFTGS